MLFGSAHEFSMQTYDFEITVNGKDVWPKSKERVPTWPETVAALEAVGFPHVKDAELLSNVKTEL